MKNPLGNSIIRFLATGFGTGYIPVAPGTFGSLVGVGLFYLLSGLDRGWLFLIAVLLGAGSIWIADHAETCFGQKDCQKIVIDEVAGQFLAFLFVPVTPLNLLLGFVFFRFFDIKKIFPADWAQNNLPGGAGVVVDDLVAGLQAALFLFIVNWIVMMG